MVANPDLLLLGLGATDEQLTGVPTPIRYRVFVRDASYQIVDELTDWLSLKLVIRFNRVGTWALSLSRQSPSAALLTRNAGIVVRRKDVTIFSGSVATEWSRTATTLEVAGYDDMALLETAIARPTPSLAEAPFPDAYWVRQGVASTIMRELVAVNIGPDAPEDWKIDALALGSDPLLGNDDPLPTMRARFDPLITLLAEFAVSPYAGGLRFTLMQSDTVSGTLEFNVLAPPDRTTDAVFSVELDTAQDFRDTWQFPQGNYFLVAGGDGFGPDRTVVEGGDAANIAEVGRRIVRFIDARGVTDPAELQQKLAEALAGVVSARLVTIEPFQVPALEFGVDFDMGDVVSFVIDGETFTDVIREVEIDLTVDRGVVVTPTMGNAGVTNDDRLARYVATVADRISNIERNWNVPNDSIIRDMLHALVKPPIGKIEWLAGPTLPSGYLRCDGGNYHRSNYPLLYAELGHTWGGSGDTFNVPDLRNKFAYGAGNGVSLGQYGGSAEINIRHTHGPSTLSFPHSHDHDHGLDAHDHKAYEDGGNIEADGTTEAAEQGTQYEEDSAGSGFVTRTEGHKHEMHDIPTKGQTGFARKVSGDGEFTSTQSSNVGITNAGSPSGETTAELSANQSIIPPFAGLYPVIYAGA